MAVRPLESLGCLPSDSESELSLSDDESELLPSLDDDDDDADKRRLLRKK